MTAAAVAGATCGGGQVAGPSVFHRPACGMAGDRIEADEGIVAFPFPDAFAVALVFRIINRFKHGPSIYANTTKAIP